MHLFKTIDACRQWSNKQNSTVGFVPTMGALHMGHLSLVQKSVRACAKTIVSIYINPAQFSPCEDLEKYPKTLGADLKQLEKINVDAVFLPTNAEMYPNNDVSFKYYNSFFKKLEGVSRPHFFLWRHKSCIKTF